MGDAPDPPGLVLVRVGLVMPPLPWPDDNGGGEEVGLVPVELSTGPSSAFPSSPALLGWPLLRVYLLVLAAATKPCGRRFAGAGPPSIALVWWWFGLRFVGERLGNVVPSIDQTKPNQTKAVPLHHRSIDWSIELTLGPAGRMAGSFPSPQPSPAAAASPRLCG